MEFNPDEENAYLKNLKASYAASVYSAATKHSQGSGIKDQVVEVQAELAARQVRLQSLEVAEKERTRLAELEAHRSQQNLELEKEIEGQRRRIGLLQAQHDVQEMTAKCNVLKAAVSDEDSDTDSPAVGDELDYNIRGANYAGTLNLEAQPFIPQRPLNEGTCLAQPVVTSQSVNDISFAQVLANAMTQSRLPVPVPKVFSGNPIEFVAFRGSFKTLIEDKGISAKEKIYYLQQYVAGEAKDAIEGCFYGTTENDYARAWQTLESRYGHQFKIQEAFRERLEGWPRVGPKDGVALQKYADFLKCCLDAMPHVKGLSILNDWKENQKLVGKLPDWGVMRWSRKVSDALDDTGEYPTFNEFVTFVEKEAKIVCHPVMSLAAVRGSESSHDVKVSKEKRQIVKGKGTAFSTRANEDCQRNAKAKVQGVHREASVVDTSALNRFGTRNIKADEHNMCPFCSGDHYLSSCLEFSKRNISERNAFVQSQKRCFGCLRVGHISRRCNVRHICKKCKGRHPTVLHDSEKEKKPEKDSVEQDETQRSVVSLSTERGNSGTTTVVPVWLSSSSNPHVEKLVYALLDTQSDSTFVDDRVCEELSVPTEPVKLKLTTMLGKDVNIACKRVKGLRVRGYTSAQYIDLPPTYTQESIPLDREHISTCETAREWSHLAAIAPEMPLLMDCEVGLLIGYNCSTALAPRQVITGDIGQPYAIRTDLGWSVVGAPDDRLDVTGFCHRVSVREVPVITPCDVLKVLESDFKDLKHSDVSVSQSDIQFLQILEGGVRQNVKGHIEMPLPFKVRPKLPNNRKLAERRLHHLKGRLDKDPQYKEHYTQFMQDMIKDGDAEPVSEVIQPGGVCYIPHHGVYHPKKPGKLRVVFDCSAKFQGTSLNDHLLTGPDLTNSLLGVLCRFRRHPVAIMCDVEKMFHRFHVHPDDRDYLRFLWWEGGDTSKDPQDYRMNVHLFGATSSPGCANFGLKYLSKAHESEYPLAAPFLCQEFYVDDGVTSVENVEVAIQLVTESRELCAKGKLRLHKFISNNQSVVDSIPAKERAVGLQEVDLGGRGLPAERALGVRWCIGSDAFTFQVQVKEQPETRRGILSVVSSIYDPLGFLAPFVLLGKIILQEMCRRGISWDDPLPGELKPRWQKWKADICNLTSVKIPRTYKPADFSAVNRVELHHFSDASTDGYGVCSYIRFVGKNDVHCTLVMAKSRVSPTKVVTVPRLELTAAVIAVKVSCKLRDELQMKIDNEYFWCDSQVVLAYINSDARRFHVFVANRVQFIREHTEVKQWQYVSTKDNPADYASRGLTATELSTSSWLRGPDFLWQSDLVISTPDKPSLILGDPEVKIHAMVTESSVSNDMLCRLCRFSSWSLLVRVVARIRRLACGTITNQPLTVHEIDQAGKVVIGLVQHDAFSHDIQTLVKQSNVSAGSKLRNFNPFICDGLIRVGGRLKNSTLTFDLKYPILLPKRSHITRLIIAHCHSEIHHQGRGQTLNAVRNKGYWIIGGSRVVAELIHGCVQCRKLRRPAEEQMMADLPEDRVEAAPPFTYVGMDCFGPFLTRRGRSETKRYGLLLTCLCSRAVHIEMLDDMSTDALINGLRCFIAVRGAVRHIRCDQGSNFIGAENELKAAMVELQSDKIASYLLDHQCDFIFNAPSSSHVGGVWERQIRTIKNVLKSTLALCPGRLDDSSLRTLFYEAMAIVNSRPLTLVSNDPAEEPLTPNHLITMKSATLLPPPGHFVKEDMYSQKRWRRVQYLTEQFWSRWRKEFVLSLNQRQKWSTPRRNVRIGDVVLLIDSDTPRMQWPRGIVVDTKTSGDGLVRRVKVRVGTSRLDKRGRLETAISVLERPVQKVVVLMEAE